MLNLDPAKLLIIAVIAVVLLGPDRLPEFARQVGAAWKSFQDFRHKMETEVRKSVPDLPSGQDISRLARSPTALLDHLSAMTPPPPDAPPAADPALPTEAAAPADPASPTDTAAPADPVLTSDAVTTSDAASPTDAAPEVTLAAVAARSEDSSGDTPEPIATAPHTRQFVVVRDPTMN